MSSRHHYHDGGEMSPLLPFTTTASHTQEPSLAPSKQNLGIIARLFPIEQYSLQDFIAESGTGLINAVVCIPVLIGFTQIVYSHDAFAPYRPFLMKLMLWSSLCHQLTMTLFSSLSFSIGQVQDAGLIFLGVITTKITERILTQHDLDFTDSAATLANINADLSSIIISTAIFTVSLYTIALGLALCSISRYQLASLVTYLPLSVLSAYLAYIGLFCVQAGISISTGFSLTHPSQVVALLFDHPSTMGLAVPGLCLGLLLMVLCRKVKSPLTLPLGLSCIPVLFYIIMVLIMGYSIDDLRSINLLSPTHGDNVISHAIERISLFHVDFFSVPTVIVDWGMMVLFVAFSSALDVIAIEVELGTPLDINRELNCVGMSNIISGSLLGYTGSYIFSQTIFTSRTKPKSRLPGIVVILLEFTALILPFDPVSYLPRCWFAATLSFIGFELILEWLIQQYIHKKVEMKEYCLTIFTFVAILFTNLQFGLCVGMLLALASFVVMYSKRYSIEVYNFYHTNTFNIISYIPQNVKMLIYPQYFNNFEANNHDSSNHAFVENITMQISGSTTKGHLEYNSNSFVSQTTTTPIAIRTSASFASLLPHTTRTDALNVSNPSIAQKEQQLRYQLTKSLRHDVYILELTGHLHFMVTPILLDRVKDIVSTKSSKYYALNASSIIDNHNNTNTDDLHKASGVLSHDAGFNYDDLDDPFNVMVSAHPTPSTSKKNTPSHLGPTQQHVDHSDTHDDGFIRLSNRVKSVDIDLCSVNSLTPNLHYNSFTDNTNVTTAYPLETSPNNNDVDEKRTIHIPVNSTIVIDCTNVKSLDSSALRTFKLIINLCHQFNTPYGQKNIAYDVLFTGLSPAQLILFANNNIDIFNPALPVNLSFPLQSHGLPGHTPFCSTTQFEKICAAYETCISKSVVHTICDKHSELLALFNINDLINVVGENQGSSFSHISTDNDAEKNSGRGTVASNKAFPTFLPPSIIQKYVLNHIKTPIYTPKDNIICAYFNDMIQTKLWIVAKYYFIHSINNINAIYE